MISASPSSGVRWLPSDLRLPLEDTVGESGVIAA
jgi:hypothetical protein